MQQNNQKLKLKPLQNQPKNQNQNFEMKPLSAMRPLHNSSTLYNNNKMHLFY